MKRTTVTIPGELEAALEAYWREAEIPPGILAALQGPGGETFHLLPTDR